MFILILSDSEWFRLKLIEIEYIHGNLKSKTVRSWQSSEPINCLLICLQTWKVFLSSFRLIPIIFNQFIWNSRNSWISKKLVVHVYLSLKYRHSFSSVLSRTTCLLPRIEPTPVYRTSSFDHPILGIGYKHGGSR